MQSVPKSSCEIAIMFSLFPIVCPSLLPLLCIACPSSAPSLKALDISDIVSVYLTMISAVAFVPGTDVVSAITAASFAVTHSLPLSVCGSLAYQ